MFALRVLLAVLTISILSSVAVGGASAETADPNLWVTKPRMPDIVIRREVRDADLPIHYEQQADPIAWKLAVWQPRDGDAFS